MMKCSMCGAELTDGQPHCPACHANNMSVSMTCDAGGECTCPTCGNKVMASEAKCDACAGIAAK